MSYLLDKKIKRKKLFYIIFSVAICVILFYFRLSIFNGFAYASHKIFRPVLVTVGNIREKIANTNSFFISKSSLYKENADLKSRLDEGKAVIANYNSILAENINLKEVLGRKVEKTNIILATILSKPNRSPYDTLLIDAGIKAGVKEGNIVFAFGNIPIGRIASVYLNSSKIVLFSNGGEKTQGVVSGRDVFVELVGRGGGNFEMILLRDFILTKGDQVVLPGIYPYVLGIIETIISDPRDPFQKALLVSPVNIQELKFVQVETQK